MTLLEVEDLTVSFGDLVVVDHVSFTIERAGRLAIIGESGSGKTMSALSVIGLLPDTASVRGRILFDGRELLGRGDRELSQVRGEDIAMVFQNPLTSLNPLMRVGKQIAEPLRRHHGHSRRSARAAAIELCARVGLPEPARAVQAYPHQLSGGQRQRIGIAIALACRPSLLIADEPTTALDVTVQAEVLAVLAELIATEGTALLFITHDVALVPLVADEMLVMRHGRFVESGPVGGIVADPRHPYTRQLFAAARVERRWHDRHGVPYRRFAEAQWPRRPLLAAHSLELARSHRCQGAPVTMPGAASMADEVLLSARGVRRTYRLPRTSLTGPRSERHALTGVDLDVRQGESMGIVGESGSGKSTLARILLGLDGATAGHVTYRGREVRPGSPSSLRWLRREVQIVFQDPLSSLDPRMTAAAIIREPLIGLGVAGDHLARIDEVLSAVGIDPAARDRFPHEFSGGQQQRIAIARALAARPRLLIADEPVSSLDVSVRAQILDLLEALMRDLDLSLVLVSHDLGVIRTLCDSVLVLHAGTCVERGPTDSVFSDPRDDYTRRLLAAVPRLPEAAAP